MRVCVRVCACVCAQPQINLVDLAGSEKMKTHQSVSERRLQELTSINQSLSNLGNCVRALGQPGRSHIPYRNSKLTRLLQDSLGGNTKTTFIVTLSPSEDALEETLSTLQFANRAKKVYRRRLHPCWDARAAHWPMAGDGARVGERGAGR